MRVVLSTWGSLGDLHPYMALGIELTRRGHDVSIVTLSTFREMVTRAGLGFHPLRPDVSPDDPGARDLVRRVLDPKEGSRYLFEEIFAPVIRETYEDTLAAVRAGGGADLLVTHQVPLTGPLVAQVTGVTWVSGVLLPMVFISAYDPATPPQAPGLQKIMAVHPAIARVVARLGRTVTRPWVESVYRLRSELGLPPGGHPAFEGQHAPARVLGLFSSVFAQKQPDFPPQAVITGFPFYDGTDERPAPPELVRFLDAGEPPVVFTLGSSGVWIADDFYDVSLAAVRALGCRAVLLAADQADPLRRRGLPDSVLAVDYAPHSFVMPRASAIVHQGGVGTTAQALRAGRPMLVVPFGQDQPDNARRSVGLGVARTISRLDYKTGRVTAELSNLLKDESFSRRAAEVSSRIRAERGTVTACDEIERVVAGSSVPA